MTFDNYDDDIICPFYESDYDWKTIVDMGFLEGDCHVCKHFRCDYDDGSYYYSCNNLKEGA